MTRPHNKVTSAQNGPIKFAILTGGAVTGMTGVNRTDAKEQDQYIVLVAKNAFILPTLQREIEQQVHISPIPTTQLGRGSFDEVNNVSTLIFKKEDLAKLQKMEGSAQCIDTYDINLPGTAQSLQKLLGVNALEFYKGKSGL